MVLNTETVTILRASGRPTLGERPVRAPHHQVPGCVVAPQESNEISQYSSATVTVWELYCPATADIFATDQVSCRGLVWDVIGEPSDWRSPFSSWRPGKKVVLTRTRG